MTVYNIMYDNAVQYAFYSYEKLKSNIIAANSIGSTFEWISKESEKEKKITFSLTHNVLYISNKRISLCVIYICAHYRFFYLFFVHEDYIIHTIGFDTHMGCVRVKSDFNYSILTL